MDWGPPDIQQANGSTHSLLHRYLDRLDGKIDTILMRMGEGAEVHRRLTAESLQHRDHIAELRTAIQSIKVAPQQSRLQIITAELKEVMPLREWFLGALVVGMSLGVLQVPDEIKAAIITAVAKAVGGG